MQVNNCSRVGYLDHQAKHSSQSEMASVKAKNLDRLTFQARLLTKATIKCGKIEKFLSDCNEAGPVSAAPPRFWRIKRQRRRVVPHYYLPLKILDFATCLWGVHKLRLRDEVLRWSKNVHFLSTFMP